MPLLNLVKVLTLSLCLVVATSAGGLAESRDPTRAPAARHGAAGGVPNFDIASICRGAVDPTVETPGGCATDEQGARDELVKNWTKYSPAERSRCTLSMTELPSYAELLTCLEMEAEAKKMPSE